MPNSLTTSSLRAPTVRPTRAPNEKPAIQIGRPGACARRKSSAARTSSSSPTPFAWLPVDAPTPRKLKRRAVTPPATSAFAAR